MEFVDLLNFYNESEFSVIPITAPSGGYSDGKRPAINEWMTYMTRRATKFEQTQWWPVESTGRGAPQLNIGIVTGAVSNIAVIDADDEDTYQRLMNVGEGFHNTLTAKTGKGYHIYFRPDEHRRSSTFVLNGLTHHLSQNGRFVIAPPSNHRSGKTYEFINTSGISSLKVNDVIQWIQSAGGEISNSINRVNDERPVNWASDLCTRVTEGGRNTIAAQMCGLLIRKFSYDPGLIDGLMKAWNSYYLDPPLSERELSVLIDGEYRRYGPKATA